MRRLGIALGIILLFALWMLSGAAWISARPSDPMLWPAREGMRTVESYVVSNGYHAGLALPRAALAEFASGGGYPALIAVSQRFAAYDWIEFGWGDREFYQSVPTPADATLGLALRALFARGRDTVLHVVGISGDPVLIFPPASLMKVPLSRNGFDKMLQKLEATFVPPQNGALPDLGRGLYGPSVFYPATGRFGMFHVCNHWVEELVGAGGLPTTPVLATLPAGLLLNLRWRAGLAAPVAGRD
jgi:uncharacterized protein (TIGR02117 family)